MTDLRKTTDTMVCRINGSGEPKPHRIADALKKLDRLIWKVATGFHSKVPHLDLEDLYQQGSLGVLIAWQKFDTSKDTAFITYAHWWILKYVQMFCCRNEYPVSLNAQNQKLYKELCMASSSTNDIEVGNDRHGALANLARKSNKRSSFYKDNEDCDKGYVGYYIDNNINHVETNASSTPILNKVLTKLREKLSPVDYFILTSYKGLVGDEPLDIGAICLRLGISKAKVKDCLKLHKHTIELTLGSLNPVSQDNNTVIPLNQQPLTHN